MNNITDNLTRALENEIEQLLENYINQGGRYTTDARSSGNNDAQIMELHLNQLASINNLVTQYSNQLNVFQENMREMIQLLRTTVHSQNNYYANISRRRGNTHGVSNLSNDRQSPFNNYDMLFSYILPTNRPRGRTSNHLTPQQIANATQSVIYNESMGEERCPITLDNFTVGETICQIRHCSHIFKTDALMNWFNRNVGCPVCRYDLRNYEPPSQEAHTPVTELPTPILQRSTRSSSFANGLTSLIQGLSRGLQIDENMGNRTYTFEIPLYIDDLSGNIM
jgi:hypothetical protein